MSVWSVSVSFSSSSSSSDSFHTSGSGSIQHIISSTINQRFDALIFKLHRECLMNSHLPTRPTQCQLWANPRRLCYVIFISMPAKNRITYSRGYKRSCNCTTFSLLMVLAQELVYWSIDAHGQLDRERYNARRSRWKWLLISVCCS